MGMSKLSKNFKVIENRIEGLTKVVKELKAAVDSLVGGLAET